MFQSIGVSRIKKNMDTLKFRLSLAQGLVEKHGVGVRCPIYG
jgi:hypothetical protein